MTSIRGRTAVLVAACMGVLLVIGGVTLATVLRRAMVGQFDETLVAKGAALRSLTRFDGVKVEVDFAGDSMPRFAKRPTSPTSSTSPVVPTPAASGDDAEYFVIWVQEGSQWRLLEQSESLGAGQWDTETITGGPVGLEEGHTVLSRDGLVVRDVTLPSGRAGRIVFAQFVPTREGDEAIGASADTPAPTVRLLVAVSRVPLDHTLSIITWWIMGVGATLALMSMVAAWWTVSRGMAPLYELSTRVRALGPETLGTRFDSAGMPDELRPIAEQLGGLLSRLQEAFEREKRFSAAASHELRTPIAELAMLLEVASSRTRTSEEWSRTAQTALGVLARARSLCETLLSLSRADAGGALGDAGARTDVARVLAEQAARSVAMHGGDARRVRIQCEEGLLARVDEGVLASIVGNLIDNALRHGEVMPESPVLIDASEDQGRVRIGVTNSAPALTVEDLERLFEAFWRKDASRQDQRGSGLGLTVSRSLARASGGDIVARLDGHGTLTLLVTIAPAS